MSVIISVFYPMWYASYRNEIKELVDLGTFTTARDILNQRITEHNDYLTFIGEPKDINYGEKLMMDHALLHLNTVINDNDPEFFDNGVIKHQSDIVKSALLQPVKEDYNSD